MTQRIAGILTLIAFFGAGVRAQDSPLSPPPEVEQQQATPAETPAATPQAATPDTPPQQLEDSRDRILFSSDTERLWPLTKKLMRNTVMDQRDIWTSPLRINRSNAGWWVLFGAGTAAFIATDRHTSRWLPNTNDQSAISRDISQPGAAYTLYPIAAGFYIVGALADSPKSREVGALGFEALTDSLIVVSILKEVARRERPEEGRGNGRFFVGGTSFPSGHAIMSWSLASVVAHEYHGTVAVPIVAYGLASLVSVSRFSGRKHFASDILAGGAMGWFIGRYVYRTHVDHTIHRKPIAVLTRPDITPMMEPGSRTYGVSLSWKIGQ